MPKTSSSSSRALWWIRRDLRLHHNPTLQRAVQEGFEVIPVVILDPVILESRQMGSARKKFYYQGLEALQERISRQGGRLILRAGRPEQEISRLAEETESGRVYAERDYSPYARSRDAKVNGAVDLRLIQGLTIADPDQICTNAGDPYQVYSYYRKKWKSRLFDRLRSLEPSDHPLHFYTPPAASEGLPEGDLNKNLEVFRPGEKPARGRLAWFTGGETPPVYDYQENRDRPDRNGTSGLSPYLHFGMISIEEVFQAGLEALDRAGSQKERQGAETWLDELIWREFYQMILYHHPRVLQESFRETYSGVAWRDDREDFQRWKEGRTGYPLVDAGIRQLLAEHWMHNRVRMVTASFLVKDLLIDWRRGENWFMEQLLDADLAANNGGWQWVAGTGTDAAPYFRIFNPTTQAEKHDPGGEYIRKYLPELREVPDRYIHQPWTMSESLQEEVSCRIGVDYPGPIVNHQEARERALEIYQLARE